MVYNDFNDRNDSSITAAGLNPVRSKLTNHVSILQTIYRQGPVLRSEIASQLGLSMPTITAAVNSMIASGLIQETGDPISLSSKGRKARLVDIVPGSRLFLGAEMRHLRHAVVLSDLRGKRSFSKVVPFDSTDYEKNVQHMCKVIVDFLDENHLTFQDLSGMGIGAPGMVNAQEGILDYHVRFGWRNKHIRDDIARLTGYTGPISINNNVTARATSLQYFRRELIAGAESYAFLFIGTGIACPLIINMPNGYASVVGSGEVGKMIINPHIANGRATSVRRTAEELCSDAALLSLCQSLMLTGQAPVLTEICPEPENLTMQHLLAAQKDPDSIVGKLIDTAIIYLGIVMSNIINFSNPQVIFVEGTLFDEECNQTKLYDAVAPHLYSQISKNTRFVFLHTDPWTGAMGAASLAVSDAIKSYQE